MRVSLITALAFVGMSFLATSNASVLTDRLTFDGPGHYVQLPLLGPFQGGGEDKIQDDSITDFLDRDGSGGFSVNDVLYGIVNTTNTLSSGVGDLPVSQLEQITIIFSAKITSLTGPGGSISLGPVGDSLDLFDLRNLLSPSIVDDFVTGPTDNSIFAIMSNSIGIDDAGGINPLSVLAGSGGANTITTVLTNANGWFADAVGGMIPGTTDFFQFLPGIGGGTERGGFSIEETTFAYDTAIPVDVWDFATTTVRADVTLDVGLVNPPSIDQASRGWDFRDQSSFFVNLQRVIPEPASAMVWGFMVFALGIRGLRRRAL